MNSLSKSIVAADFAINGRSYHASARPLVAMCIDGCGDEYLSCSIAHGRMPHVARLAARGYRGLVRGALPSFTNVNNCAIVTGVSPAQTGIGGNYIIDPETGEEVMTNSSRFLRRETILAAASAAGRRVAMITAKDKLRELLSRNMNGIAFSAEKAHEAMLPGDSPSSVEALLGPAPAIYSADASLYVLRAGPALIKTGRADLLYLSLTDYMQHSYAPDAPESLDFYAAIDVEIGRILELGALIAATADHGMNAKCRADGKANVIFLESLLTERFGPGFRVICPITDPYVAHHGALGSAVTVYFPTDGKRNIDPAAIAASILEQPGIAEVYDRATAAKKCELPADRIGDLFVLSGRDVVVGRTPAQHDLSQLHGTLRSHGGRYEEMVPLILSEPLNARYRQLAEGDPRNFDLLDFLCNGTLT